MNRPTKYRIWDKERKIWKEDYHYHLAPNGQLYYGGMNITEHNEIVFWTGLHDGTKWEQLSEYEQESWLQQGRNAEEWNGKEIYEGDILEDDGGKGEVEWVQEHCAFMVFTRMPSIYHRFDSDGQLKFLKVIGNVYDNPELLEESK